MKTLSSVAAAVVFGMALVGSAQAEAIDPAVQFTGGTPQFNNQQFTLGYQFTLSGSVVVNALGYYDDGLGNDHQVAIWDSSGSIVASTTVLWSDPSVDQFTWDSIPKVTLRAGTYRIGGEYLGVGDIQEVPATVATIPQFTWISAEQAFGAGLNYPTNALNIYGQNGLLATDFSVSVPEPATWAVMLGGLFGLGMMLRSASRRVRQAAA